MIKMKLWLNNMVSSDDPENLLLAYIEIEKNITKEEGQSPASKLSLYMSRQQQINMFIQAASERERSGGLLPQENSLHELFTDLGLHRGSVQVAAEHEEFIANINRRALDINLIEVLGRRAAVFEEKIRSASLSVASLHMLYEKQDLLLGKIYGDSYGSEREMLLEEEVDTIRNYRDAFSSGALLWNHSATTVQEGAQLLTGGVTAWKSVQAQRSPETKITMATEARNAIQEAAILIELAQDSMPAVQFPYCTKRELTAIFQAIEYIFTDILIEERYRHALQVYKNFHERAVSLSLWINQVYDSTLKRDLADIDRSISRVSRSLRGERIKIICEKLGVENRYDAFPDTGIRQFVPEKMAAPKLQPSKNDGIRGVYAGKDTGLHDLGNMFRHSDLHAEFERNLAARRNAMWPSRTIEALQTMTSNDRNYS